MLLMETFFFATTRGVVSWDLWPIYPLILGMALLAGFFAYGRDQPVWLQGAGWLIGTSILFLAIIWTTGSLHAIGKLWPLLIVLGGVLLILQQTRHAHE
jgi:hypothetical protein